MKNQYGEMTNMKVAYVPRCAKTVQETFFSVQLPSL